MQIGHLDQAESRWPGCASSEMGVDALPTTFLLPKFDQIKHLSCGRQSRVDKPELDCKIKSNIIYIPPQYLSNGLVGRFKQIRVLAIEKIPDWFKWHNISRSPTVEEVHVDAYRFDFTTLQKLERLQQPLLTLWQRPRESLMAMYGNNYKAAQKWNGNLLEMKTVVRSRSDGTTYVVRLRHLCSKYDVFMFEGMVAYMQMGSDELEMDAIEEEDTINAFVRDSSPGAIEKLRELLGI